MNDSDRLAPLPTGTQPVPVPPLPGSEFTKAADVASVLSAEGAASLLVDEHPVMIKLGIASALAGMGLLAVVMSLIPSAVREWLVANTLVFWAAVVVAGLFWLREKRGTARKIAAEFVARDSALTHNTRFEILRILNERQAIARASWTPDRIADIVEIQLDQMSIVDKEQLSGRPSIIFYWKVICPAPFVSRVIVNGGRCTIFGLPSGVSGSICALDIGSFAVSLIAGQASTSQRHLVDPPDHVITSLRARLRNVPAFTTLVDLDCIIETDAERVIKTVRISGPVFETSPSLREGEDESAKQ